MLPDEEQLNPSCSWCSTQSCTLNFPLSKIHKVTQYLKPCVYIMTSGCFSAFWGKLKIPVPDSCSDLRPVLPLMLPCLTFLHVTFPRFMI